MLSNDAAVYPLASFVLNREWTVLSASAGAAPWLGPAVGRDLWEVWECSEPIFRPMYERAWRDGYAEGREFFMGVLFHVTAEVIGDELRVVYSELAHLDLTTCDTLEASIALMRGITKERARDSATHVLRLVPADLGEW